MRRAVSGEAQLLGSDNLDQKGRHSCTQEGKRTHKLKQSNAGMLFPD